MRLYNKTPREIWDDLPLPYRIVVVAGAVFIVFTLIFLLVQAGSGIGRAMNAGKGPLDIKVTSAAGMLDPSMASDGSSVNVLAYTSLDGRNGVRVSLATAAFPCQSWRWNIDVFEERNEALLAPDGISTLAQGVTRYETPSIVYDPQDRAAPWKIFAYRYFWINDPRFAQIYSTIVMRTAQTPTGPWTKEEWLLASAPDRPPPPYQNLIRAHINTMSPDLAGMTGYSRPSVIEDRGVLLMSLTAFKGPTDIDRVILLASLDHGKRWVYAGTLLDRAQLDKIGAFTRISGASLLKQGQAIYLAAVLGDAQVGASGTYLFRIVDPGKAKLLTNEEGTPTPVRFIERQSTAPTAQGGGYAAYDETCPLGIITAEYSGLLNNYRLFSTLITPSGN